jgi:D-alanyl-D-alanine carboxypeptidase
MAILLAPAPVLAAEQASIVVDAASGEVLSSSDPTALWRPASLTKLMTLYLTFEEVAAGRLKLTDVLTTSAYAAAMPPSELGLSKGEKISVENAILATITRSANDAAVVLAERVGGDDGDREAPGHDRQQFPQRDGPAGSGADHDGP